MTPAAHETALEKNVRDWVEMRTGEGLTPEQVFWELSHGCSSGVVGHLIYYSDTLAFYKEHQKEIGALLTESCDDSGLSPHELLKDWDKSDPLALEASNQNLLAWFAFEETGFRLAGAMGVEP